MSTSGGSWRVARRLAEREVRRHPWRHLLVVGLILVPVLAALAAFSAIATWQDADDRSDRFAFPSNEVIRTDRIQRYSSGGEEIPLDDPRAATLLGLPTGISTEVSWQGSDWLTGDRERPDGNGPQLIGTEVYETGPGAIEQSRFVVDDGRLPRSSTEIFLTAPAARAGGWVVGDTLMSARTGRTFDVVGVGELGEFTDRQAAAVTDVPDSFWGGNLPGLHSVDVGDELVSTEAQQSLTARVPDAVLRQELLSRGFYQRSGGADLDDRLGPAMTMAAAAICAVVAIVASAALAISSRRQLRTIGLLSTVGTDPATIRRSMILQGAIPGLVAGVAAVAIAVVAAWAANSVELLERFTHVAGSRFVLSASGSAIAVVLGIASGTLAAWFPARTSSRIPTLAALAGRRPVGPVPTGVPVAGAMAWAGGACLLLVAFESGRTAADDGVGPFLIIAGIAAMALGTVGLAPAVIAVLGPLAGRFRGTWRMGLRGLARHRMQSAATAAAIGVVLALPVGLLVTRDGMNDRSAARNRTECCLPVETTSPRSDPFSILRAEGSGVQVDIGGALRSEAAAEAVESVRGVLGPDAAVIRTILLVDQDGAWQNVATIDEDLAAEVLEPWAAEAIVDGQAISRSASTGEVAFTAEDRTASFDLADRRAEVFGLAAGNASYLVGLDALDGVGAERPADSIAVVRTRKLDPGERSRLLDISSDSEARALLEDPTLAEIQRAAAGEALPGDGVHVSTMYDGDRTMAGWETADPNARTNAAWDRALLAMAVTSGALALLVLTITLSLRSVDGQADRQAAFAAGVAPHALRRQRSFEGVVLALFGAMLAVPLGWIPVLAAQLGTDGTDGTGRYGTVAWMATPGWIVVPILLAPAVAAAVLWTVVPALAAAVRRARGRDLTDDLVPSF